MIATFNPKKAEKQTDSMHDPGRSELDLKPNNETENTTSALSERAGSLVQAGGLSWCLELLQPHSSKP